MALRACVRCGIALTPGLGGEPLRIMAVFARGRVMTADYCRAHYQDAADALDAIFMPHSDRADERRGEVVRSA